MRRFDRLHAIRYRLEHNQISRSLEDKDNLAIFVTLNEHFLTEDIEVKHFAIQLIGDILPHLEPRIQDACMSKVIQNLVPCLGSSKVATRKAAVQVLQVYLRCTSDLQSLLRSVVVYGLEHKDPVTSREVGASYRIISVLKKI